MPSSTTYPVYKTQSGWTQILDNDVANKSASRCVPESSLEDSYDYIIVGAGYTGLAAAKQLAKLQNNSSILVIDSAPIAEGSSGRNSGFVISLPHNTKISGHASNVKTAKKVIRVYANALNWLDEIVKKNNINCGWNNIGKYHGAVTTHGKSNLRNLIKEYQELEIQHKPLQADEMAYLTGTKHYDFGLWSTNNVFIQPAALVHGLVQNLPKNVTVSDKNPVVSISKEHPYVIKTTNRRIKCKTLILANNGFAKKLGFLKSRLVTIYTYAGMTHKLNEEQLSMHGHNKEWGLIPANRLGTTLRKTLDGRFMVRSAYSYEKQQTSYATEKLLQSYYVQRYPNLKNHAFEYVWGGATALTRNGSTYFGKIKPNLYASVGCNGAGVLKGTAYGKLLADYIVGSQSQDLTDVLELEKPSWIPPEPFRRIGVMSTIQYQKLKAGKEK